MRRQVSKFCFFHYYLCNLGQGTTGVGHSCLGELSKGSDHISYEKMVELCVSLRTVVAAFLGLTLFRTAPLKRIPSTGADSFLYFKDSERSASL